MKKIIGLLLSALIIFGAMPISFASAAETTMVDDLSQVENLSSIISDSSKNIIYSWGNSATEDAPMTFYTTYTNSTVTKQKFQTSVANVTRMTNGDFNDTHGDLSGGFQWFNTNKEWVEGYIDVTFNFPDVAEITNFLLASDKIDSSDRRIWEYQVFAADTLETLYSDTNLLYHYNEGGENTPSHGQYITFGETVSARYFGLRILKGCNPNSADGNRGHSYPRIREMAIIGSCEIPDELKHTSSLYVNPCLEALDTDYNLLNSDYVVGDGSAGTIFSGGSSATSIRSYNPDVNDLVDHDTTSKHADISGVKFFDSNGFIENVYTTVSFALVHEATIDKILVSNAVNNSFNLRTYEYEVYTSNSLSELYNVENKRGYFLNEDSLQNQVFTFDTPIVAKYVGIKILKGVQPNCTAAGSSYVRLAEVAVFGKYNTDYYDYSVTSGSANLISASGNTYSGKKFSFSAPLCKDGYTLRGWTLNGDDIEYTADRYENTSNVEFKVTEKTEVVAVYTADDEEFTSNSTYGVSSDKTKIRVPQHHVLYELKYGFAQMPQNISAKSGDTALEDKNFVKKGDTLILSSKGVEKQSLTVEIAGDFDNNGIVEVTDIVKGVDTMLGAEATEEEIFRFDINDSGGLTVSDIIRARNTVLTTPDTETDYTTATTTMANLDYKTQGRYLVKDNGAVTFDWTASGFSFNADLYGDVVLNVTQGPNDSRWYSAVIDGVEHEFTINGSSAQDVVIARNLSSGVHSIGFYKQQEGGNTITVNSVKINGKVLEADGDNDLLIEFIGDSITCGYGNLLEDGKETAGSHAQNGYNSYGTITARMLNADWSNISVSGSSLIDDRDRVSSRNHMPTEYKNAIKGSKPNSTDTPAWDFQSNRNADIVVINLGTNDSGFISHYSGVDTAAKTEYFKDLAVDFAKQIIDANGEDVKIVFAFGMMTSTPNFADAAYQEAVTELAAEGFTNAYYCRLPTDRTGGYAHPTVAGDIAAAEVLSEFIKTTVLD